MSDALLRDLVEKVDRLAEQQASMHGEYVEGKRNAKEVARTLAARVEQISSKVDGIDQRTLQDSGTLRQVLAEQRVTNGRVNRHDGEIEELERDRDIQKAIAGTRSWRFGALITFVTTVASGSIVAVIALLLR